MTSPRSTKLLGIGKPSLLDKTLPCFGLMCLRVCATDHFMRTDLCVYAFVPTESRRTDFSRTNSRSLQSIPI
jgi:hypothetical protein